MKKEVNINHIILIDKYLWNSNSIISKNKYKNLIFKSIYQNIPFLIYRNKYSIP